MESGGQRSLVTGIDDPCLGYPVAECGMESGERMVMDVVAAQVRTLLIATVRGDVGECRIAVVVVYKGRGV